MNSPSFYIAKGIPDERNIPDARSEGAFAQDAIGTVWVYGKE